MILELINRKLRARKDSYSPLPSTMYSKNKSLGTPPGVPTMKGATAEPENTHESYNTIIKGLGGHCVPDGWIQRPKRNIALRQEKNANGLIQLYMVSIMNTNAKACGMCT